MHFNLPIFEHMHFTIYDGILSTSFFISLSVFLVKPTPFYLKLFPVYFISAIILGMIMEYKSRHGQYNTGLGNSWSIIEFCFYYFVIREVIVNIKVKRAILFIIFVFAIFTSFNVLYIQKKVGFNPVNFTIGCVIAVSLCIYYFVELFQKTEVQSLSILPAFWIVSSILFSNVLSFPLFALQSFMDKLTRTNFKAYHILFDNIDIINNTTVFLSAVLYWIGFLCRIRINKSIS